MLHCDCLTIGITWVRSNALLYSKCSKHLAISSAISATLHARRLDAKGELLVGMVL